ncbi:hypothetical protein CPB85DRAFT_1456627 [Mucidula mucida]|nr:hypothetical protein CPB85DRAFT_1456627 [Mucidula mucida]
MLLVGSFATKLPRYLGIVPKFPLIPTVTFLYQPSDFPSRDTMQTVLRLPTTAMAGLSLPIHLGAEIAIRTSSYSPLSDALDTLWAALTMRLRKGLAPVQSAKTNLEESPSRAYFEKGMRWPVVHELEENIHADRSHPPTVHKRLSPPSTSLQMKTHNHVQLDK